MLFSMEVFSKATSNSNNDNMRQLASLLAILLQLLFDRIAKI